MADRGYEDCPAIDESEEIHPVFGGESESARELLTVKTFIHFFSKLVRDDEPK